MELAVQVAEAGIWTAQFIETSKVTSRENWRKFAIDDTVSMRQKDSWLG